MMSIYSQAFTAFRSIYYHLAVLAGSTAIITGCVSIDISKETVKRADGVNYKAPVHPFREISSDTVDQIWRNPHNGNAISFVSDCGNSSDPSLSAIEAGVVTGLADLKYLKSENTMYNGRAARHSIVMGKVDGIPSQVELMVFKKNNCIYVLSYVALAQTYSKDQKTFQNFLKEFQAP